MDLFSSVDPRFMLSGFFVGLLIGQTGMGGGALMTPILVLFFGVHPATAVGTDLLYASATKTAGTLVHGLNHTVDWRIVLRLGSGSVPATIVTLAVISRFDITGSASGRIIALVLGVMLLLTALSLIFRRRFLAIVGPVLERVPARNVARLTIITGVVLGALVTISSVGAGALGVTALLIFYPRVPMAVIVGSDIAHAVPLTLVAGLGQLAAADIAAEWLDPRYRARQLFIGPYSRSDIAPDPGDHADFRRWAVGALALYASRRELYMRHGPRPT